MDFEEVMFFVCDGSRCMEEADDPADSLLLFHPPQMTVEGKCTWSSQLLGLHRFWQSAMKKTVSSFSIGRYNLVCHEVDHRFLTVLGWPKVEEASNRLQVQALQQNLKMINHLLLSFVSSFTALAKLPPVYRHDLLLAVFSLCSFTWGDLSHTSNHLNIFKEVSYLQTMAFSLRHKCSIIAPQLSILSTLLSFRTDVLQDDIPLAMQRYRRQFLLAALRRESDEALLHNTDTNCLTTSRHKLYRLHIPTDDYQVFRLSHHQTTAIKTISTLSSSPGHTSFQHTPAKRQNKLHTHHPLKTVRDEEGRAGLLLYVLQQGGMSLVLLLDHDSMDETIASSLGLLAGSMTPLLSTVEDVAIEHILQSQWEKNGIISETTVEEPRKKSFFFDKVSEMFEALPDSELQQEIINEAQLLLSCQELQSCSITKRGLKCTAECEGNSQRFFLETEKKN